VKFHCDTDYCYLVIKDNGIGIDLNKVKNSDSLGMELIQLLTEQIDAQYVFKVDNGTVFELKFLKK